MRRENTRPSTRLPTPATLKRLPHLRTNVEKNKNTFEAAFFHLSQFIVLGHLLKHDAGREGNTQGEIKIYLRTRLMRAPLSTGVKPVGYQTHSQCRADIRSRPGETGHCNSHENLASLAYTRAV